VRVRWNEVLGVFFIDDRHRPVHISIVGRKFLNGLPTTGKLSSQYNDFLACISVSDSNHFVCRKLHPQFHRNLLFGPTKAPTIADNRGSELITPARQFEETNRDHDYHDDGGPECEGRRGSALQ